MMKTRNNTQSRNGGGRLEKRLYSVKEAAIYLGLSAWSIRGLIWNGQLSTVRMGRRVLLDIQDLDRWIEVNKVREII